MMWMRSDVGLVDGSERKDFVCRVHWRVMSRSYISFRLRGDGGMG